MTTNKPKIKSAISLKLNHQSDERKERLIKWLDAQSNCTNSLFSLIDHMIDRFGYEDITSHEITKRLILERLHYEDNASIGLTNTPVQIRKELPVENSTGESLPVNAVEEVNAAASEDVTNSAIASKDVLTEGENTQKPSIKDNVNVDSFFT